MLRSSIISLLLLCLYSCHLHKPKIGYAKEAAKTKDYFTKVGKCDFDTGMHNNFAYVSKVLRLKPLQTQVDNHIRFWLDYGLSPNDEMLEISKTLNIVRLDYYSIKRNSEDYTKPYPPVKKYYHTFKFINYAGQAKVFDQVFDMDFDKLKSQCNIKIPDTLGWTDGTLFYFELYSEGRQKQFLYSNPVMYYQYVKDPSLEKAGELMSICQSLIDKYSFRRYDE